MFIYLVISLVSLCCCFLLNVANSGRECKKKANPAMHLIDNFPLQRFDPQCLRTFLPPIVHTIHDHSSIRPFLVPVEPKTETLFSLSFKSKRRIKRKKGTHPLGTTSLFSSSSNLDKRPYFKNRNHRKLKRQRRLTLLEQTWRPSTLALQKERTNQNALS